MGVHVRIDVDGENAQGKLGWFAKELHVLFLMENFLSHFLNILCNL